jgi:proteasome lid subunit RPN8/RPN11
MTVTLTEADFNAILAWARAALPNEACGLLAGTSADGAACVKKMYLLKNVDESPEHFSMLPDEQFAAVKDMRARGIKLIGNFHSHPGTPARPSEEDKRLAFDPDLLYFILSLAEPVPVLKAFKIVDTSASEIPINIV